MVYYKSQFKRKPSEFSPWGPTSTYVNIDDVKIIIDSI